MAGRSETSAQRQAASRWARAALGAAAAVGALLAGAPEAHAQQATFYLDRLYMAGAPDDAIGLWRPQMGEKTRFYGQFGLGFALNPFRIENHIEDPNDAAKLAQVSGAPVTTQLITYLDAGVEILDRFGFQVELPVAVVQTGNVTNQNQNASARDAANLETVGLMDMRLEGRGILFRTDDRMFKLGVNASVWVPTGNNDSFDGDGNPSGGFGVSSELDFKDVFFTLNTGLHFRPPNGLNDFRVGNEWKWGVGGFVPLRGGSVRLGAQVFGSTGLTSETTFTADNTPLEWMAEGRLWTDDAKQGYVGLGGGTRLTAGYAPDFRVAFVAGYSFSIADTDPNAPGKRWKSQKYADHGADTDKDGLPDDVDLCPSDPEDGKPPNPDDGCPALPDRDGDGIPDISDKCPDNPEDFDKIDDKDGCPEDDADKDNIADAQDACPKEPGDPSPEPAKNGCPQFIRRISGSSEIQILKQVQFATGSARILQNSFGILDEVVRLLKVNPEIQHLSIEGHTDNRGSDALNEKLSSDRAHSVMQYLIDKGGIDAGRLSAAGFGPRRPIADNNTPDGRQKNRRVEFHITGQAGQQPQGQGGGAAP
ncbi:MAG: OmpA family protein [Polyangiaceae bacterium]|nr:OmpA family protein [Polyangiaceae bacterium]